MDILFGDPLPSQGGTTGAAEVANPQAQPAGPARLPGRNPSIPSDMPRTDIPMAADLAADRTRAMLGVTPRELFPDAAGAGTLPTPSLFPRAVEHQSGAIPPHMQMGPPSGQDSVFMMQTVMEMAKQSQQAMVMFQQATSAMQQQAQALSMLLGETPSLQTGRVTPNVVSPPVVSDVQTDTECQGVPPNLASSYGRIPEINPSKVSNLNPLSRSMDKGPKLPIPKVVDDQFLRKYTDYPMYLKSHFMDIFEYVAPGIANGTLSWDGGLRRFMDAPDAKAYHTTFFEELVGSGATFDREKYISGFISAFTGDVRPMAVVALHELHEGKVTQMSDSVAKYSERFFQRSRQLPQESQSTLCLLFLSGLKPELRARCCMDRDNNRWTSLSALVKHTLAEEERVNMANSKSEFPHLQSSKPVSSDSKQDYRSRFTGKKRGAAAVLAEGEDMEVETASLAAVTPAKKQAKGDNGMKQQKRKPQVAGQDFITSTGVHYKWNSLPPAGYPFLDKSKKEMDKLLDGKHLSEQHKAEMHARGICWWCKKHGHAADGDSQGMNKCPKN